MTALTSPMNKTAFCRSLSRMARGARTRSFSCPKPERRGAGGHGYLLDAEELKWVLTGHGSAARITSGPLNAT